MEPSKQPQKNSFLIPISIIIAGAMIAGALYYVKKSPGQADTAAVASAVSAHPEENMAPLTSSDHILGSPDAPVIIVEYSDTDCPYCQAFQTTLHRIVDEYGKTGKVAWVYRHFAFHPNAPKEAEATECVAELGGNDKFWQFLDLLFTMKNFKESPYKGIDTSQLPTIAASIGINKTAFSECLTSGKYAAKVTASYNDAVKSGAQGTPYTILVTKNIKVPITAGAVPYDSMKSAIQALLNENPK